MANKKPNGAAWVLRFVGSLAYLAVVWQLWQVAGVVGSVTNVFAPVLFGLAAVSAVSMFLVVLASLSGSDNTMSAWITKANFMTGFALLAVLPIIAGAWATWSWIALVGFVLVAIGSGMEKM